MVTHYIDFMPAYGSQPSVWKILTLTFQMTRAGRSPCEDCMGVQEGDHSEGPGVGLDGDYSKPVLNSIPFDYWFRDGHVTQF